MSHYSPILSFLRVSRSGDRALTCGYGAQGGLLMVVGLAAVFILWLFQVLTDSPNEAQQFGQEGEWRMKKAIFKASANLAANASTAYYVNNLPAFTIEAC
ncbi:hypothetical protein T3A99_12725 [Pseudomonas sp. N-137]|uniref:hypothetical protein n=1 Tax=Pseudomonas sp. N-137 TaxID=3108452 RepID=UPI002ADEE76A|nr:hypothetical protein [Pseudomonas sp. N-137]MEA1029432.1 hypothetical protein [Pseudomonas sp. N-137]